MSNWFLGTLVILKCILFHNLVLFFVSQYSQLKNRSLISKNRFIDDKEVIQSTWYSQRFILVFYFLS